jgi:hypothetical protein
MGDFDATSTTILLSPVQAERLVPRAALERTFAKYLEFSAERSKGAPWEAFTPYEIRNIGACVRLGWRERANELLQFFLATQRPRGWRQWPEVVWQDERTPRFLGDLPHGWVGSDYIRSVLDMLAYENEANATLVLAAGVPADWLRGNGVVVRNLNTAFGPLSYTLGLRGDEVVVHIESGLRVPACGVVVRAPTPWPIGSVLLDGSPVKVGPEGEIVVRNLPATLVLRR